MTEIPQEWLDGCAREIEFADTRHTSYSDLARAAINFLRPLIEAETRERCAVMLDTIAAWLPKEALQELRTAMRTRGE